MPCSSTGNNSLHVLMWTAQLVLMLLPLLCLQAGLHHSVRPSAKLDPPAGAGAPQAKSCQQVSRQNAKAPAAVDQYIAVNDCSSTCTLVLLAVKNLHGHTTASHTRARHTGYISSCTSYTSTRHMLCMPGGPAESYACSASSHGLHPARCGLLIVDIHHSSTTVVVALHSPLTCWPLSAPFKASHPIPKFTS